jgi:hypothetical protein
MKRKETERMKAEHVPVTKLANAKELNQYYPS